jgi:hypothetical protein
MAATATSRAHEGRGALVEEQAYRAKDVASLLAVTALIPRTLAARIAIPCSLLRACRFIRLFFCADGLDLIPDGELLLVWGGR